MEDKKITIKKLIAGALVAAAVVRISYPYVMEKYTVMEQYIYEDNGEIQDNPYIGFAADARHINAAEGTSLVYVGLLWSDFEKEEGVYDFETLEEEYYFDRWKEEGKNVVLRFVCDCPGDEAHLDIPRWLYEKTRDGKRYDNSYGMGYSPNYENEYFIECYEKAVKALGDRYGNDDFISYVEMGAIGHWGEWHIKKGEGLVPMPSEETCTRYIKAFADAFPKAKILLRRPYSVGVEFDAGVYNDMTGEEDSTTEWLSWIKEGGVHKGEKYNLNYTANPDIWKSSPVGGEFTSSHSFNNMFVRNIDRTVKLVKDSHMTFIGPKAPLSDDFEKYEDGALKVLRYVGYRYRASELKLTRNLLSGVIKLELKITNDGAAPIYFDKKVVLYVKKVKGNTSSEDLSSYERIETDIDLKSLYGNGTSATAKITLDEKYKKGEVPKIYVAIEDVEKNEISIKMPMDVETLDGAYLLTGN